MLFVWLHILLPALLSLFYPTDNDLLNKVSFITDHPGKKRKKTTFISLAFFYTTANPAQSCAQGNCISAPRWLPEAGLLVPELIQYKIICQIHASESSLDASFIAQVDANRIFYIFRYRAEGFTVKLKNEEDNNKIYQGFKLWNLRWNLVRFKLICSGPSAANSTNGANSMLKTLTLTCLLLPYSCGDPIHMSRVSKSSSARAWVR